jgi:3-phenylpropionate/cinnamic acid dioxygenase small subunit
MSEERGISDPLLYREVSEFLYREAQLLDSGRFQEWLQLLDEEMRYQLSTPKLTMATPGARAPQESTLLMDETVGSFKVRVQQLTTPAFTLAENPRPFTRRFIANILIEPGAGAGPICVLSNALVFRSRGNQMEPHLFSVGRRDLMKKKDGRLLLVRREAQLDESVVKARNIVGLW